MRSLCFIQPDITKGTGGLKVLNLITKELVNDYNIHVVSLGFSGDKPAYEFDKAVKIHKLFDRDIRIREALIKGGISKLRKVYRQNHIDIAVSIGASMNALLIFAALGTDVKTVFCEHLNCLNSFVCDNSQKIMQKIGARHADKIITLTKQDMDAYIDKYNVKREKIDYIYNWVDDKLLKSESIYDENSKTLLSIGRIEPVKGYDNLLVVAKTVFSKHPDWQWHIYGSGDEEKVKLENQIKDLGLSNNITIKGFANNIYDLYKQYSIFVLTSYAEGLPMVLLEAKANKLPLVSFDCLTGPSEIINDGLNGYVIKCFDNDEMAQKICMLIEDKELRKNFSKNSYSNLDLFSKEKIVRKWKKLFSEL